MYSKVDSLFWLDVKNKTLGDNEKLLFLYLLTCPHRNVLGFYIMPLPYISADLKWKIETVKERFSKLLEKGYINYDYDSETVLINNFLKYNAFENPNQVIGAIKSLELIPICQLDERLLDALKRHKSSMCSGKKGEFENKYQTLMQTVSQRVTSTVTVAVTESVAEYTCPEQNAQDRQAIISLVLNDKTEYPIFQEQVDEWADLYPAVNVIRQLRNMKGWADANPKKRKTKDGILRFVVAWLAKCQNQGGDSPKAQLIAATKPNYGNPDEYKGIESDDLFLGVTSK